MRLRFATVDVFTDRPFGGNPLAVVLDGQELTSGQMQSVAAEFNLSETTFVLPAKDPAHTAAVRIFTPRAELPFAGHPNIGTAFVLAREGRSFGGVVGDRLVFEEAAGLVRVDLISIGASLVGARVAAPQPLTRQENVSPDVVAAACSISPGDVELANHPPCIASCGAPLVLAELKAQTALAAARPRSEVFAKHLGADRVVGILLYVPSKGENHDVRARMFAPLHGIPEDPASGAVNLALVGLLAGLRPEPDVTLRLRIAQGIEMGRPSLLEATADKRNGRITGMWIGGRCVPMMSGTLDW
jgi:trans-2,3-dihydro-3-hydroxyanthranilate isomerase